MCQEAFNKPLEVLWPQGKPISEPKLQDLKSILHLIPNDAEQFYKNLKSNENIVDDIDGLQQT